MSILEQLGLALGLASLAGINLYLTVLLTGLALRFDFLQIASQYQLLDALAHPIVLSVAGVMCLMEFITDKVPWLDTLWDIVHTFIRPLGGILIGLQIMGDIPLYLQVFMALLTGVAALTTHSIKATTRLLANQSPAPATNITLSLAEDALVAASIILVLLHPVIALATFATILLISWFAFPKILRAALATWKLAWHKLLMPGRNLKAPAKPTQLPCQLDSTLKDLLLFKGGLSDKEIFAAIPCLTGKSRGIRGLSPNLDGLLILTHEMKHFYFTATKGLRARLFRIPIHETGIKTNIDSAFLSENLQLETDQMRMTLRFPRHETDLIELLATSLQKHQPLPSTPSAAETQPTDPTQLTTSDPE